MWSMRNIAAGRRKLFRAVLMNRLDGAQRGDIECECISTNLLEARLPMVTSQATQPPSSSMTIGHVGTLF